METVATEVILINQLPKDCIGIILNYCAGKRLATLAAVSTQWNHWALAEEMRRFHPGIEPDKMNEDDWIFLVSVGAYLSVVRSKFGPIHLSNACVSGCMDMVDLALSHGAQDYQDGFEAAASRGHAAVALRMWKLIPVPDLEYCVFAAYMGGNDRLIKLVEPDTQYLWNEAVAGACRGNNVALLQEILPKYDDYKSRLLMDAFDGGAQEALQFLTEQGIKCEDEESLVCVVRMGRYDAFDLFLASNPDLDVEDSFLTACCGGHIEIVRRLISREFNEDTLGVGCMLACFGRYLDVIKCIHGAMDMVDPNDWMVFLCGPEELELYMSLVHKSNVAQSTHEEIVEYLIKEGASDFGRILDAAVRQNCREMIELMTKKMNGPDLVIT